MSKYLILFYLVDILLNKRDVLYQDYYVLYFYPRDGFEYVFGRWLP